MSKKMMIYLFVVPVFWIAFLSAFAFVGLSGLWKMLGIVDIMFVIWGCGYALLSCYIAIVIVVFILGTK